MILLLFLFIARFSLSVSGTRTLTDQLTEKTCEIKRINGSTKRTDRKPGWTGDLDYTVSTKYMANEVEIMYSFNWSSLVTRPQRFTSLQTKIDNGSLETDKNIDETKHINYQFSLPKCQLQPNCLSLKEEKREMPTFELTLRLFYHFRDYKCYEISTNLKPPVYNLSNYISKGNPVLKYTDENTELFWPKFVFYNKDIESCIDNMTFTTNTGKNYSIHISDLKSPDNQSVLSACQAQNVSLTYNFKDNLPSHKIQMTIPAFSSKCNTRTTTEISEPGIILISMSVAGGALALLTGLVVFVMCRSKRRQVYTHKEIDLNPVYGTYEESGETGDYCTDRV